MIEDIYFNYSTMGRGPVVQARKDAVNKVKGKVFSLHAKLIAIAAVKGGNPDDNPALAAAIAKAKKEGVPNDNIDRAIKKGTGEDKDAVQISEIVYEGYAPGGVAVMVSTLTDNKNRTVSNIRHAFTKFGGNLGESGSVSWMFKRHGVIFIDPKKYDFETIEELVFETSAEDILSEDDYIKIITSVDDFHEVETFFEQKEIELLESKIDFIPDNYLEVTDFDTALKITKLLEAFDEEEDVNIVSSNEVISAELQQEVDAFIEQHRFKT